MLPVKLNSISVGGGLALVAAALLANAAASLVGSADKVAHADKLKRAAKSQPIADFPVSRAEEGGDEMMAMGVNCPPSVAPQHWFSSIWLVGTCPLQGQFNWGLAPFQFADVNADGRPESFSYGDGAIIAWDGSYPDECLLAQDLTMVENDEVELERSCLLDSAQLRDWVIAQSSQTPNYASGTAAGWSDADGDGDLDLYIVIRSTWSGGWLPEMSVVLENTGFEKQTFAAGDINKDGEVDGVDISILLSDWSY
jgi:hypothetical protein